MGGARRVITTSSVEGAHTLLEVVHLSVVDPTPRLFTMLTGLVGDAIVTAGPDTQLHAPLPNAGVFPASVAVLTHTVWSGPALAAVGGTLMIKSTRLLSPETEGLDELIFILYPVPEAEPAGIVVVIFPEPAVEEVTDPMFTPDAKLPFASESMAVKILPGP